MENAYMVQEDPNETQLIFFNFFLIFFVFSNIFFFFAVAS